MLIWIDLETTGLDYGKDLICEIGGIITTDDLQEVDFFHRVTQMNTRIMERIEADSFVRDMHIANELLDDMKFGSPLENNLRDFVQWIETGLDVVGSPMAGSGIHFDRRFLERDLGLDTMQALFHYRNFDVSVLNQMCGVWAETLKEKCKMNRENHRVMDDLRDAIDTAHNYRDWLFQPALQMLE